MREVSSNANQTVNLFIFCAESVGRETQILPFKLQRDGNIYCDSDGKFLLWLDRGSFESSSEHETVKLADEQDN